MHRHQHTQVHIAHQTAQIARCYPVHKELRPSIDTEEAFVKQVLRQTKQGYVLTYIEEAGEVAACMGYRIFENFVWGTTLYIDDLIVREKSKKKGFGKKLLSYAIEQGKKAKCSELHLDTGHHRHEAHRFYINQGLIISNHHFMMKLDASS